MPTRGAGAEAEAVIVAIKRDVLEAELAAVEAAGVRVKTGGRRALCAPECLSLQRASDRGMLAHYRHGRADHEFDFR